MIKPGVRVKYPWLFEAGENCWLGEDRWIDNLAPVKLGSNVCVSQGAYFCTGNHDWSDPSFGLIVRPIHVGDGAWIGAKAVIGPGAEIGECAVVAAGSVVSRRIPALEIYGGNPAGFCANGMSGFHHRWFHNITPFHTTRPQPHCRRAYEKSPNYRHYRPGRILSGRVSPIEGLRGPRGQAARVVVQHRSRSITFTRTGTKRAPAVSALRGPRRRQLAGLLLIGTIAARTRSTTLARRAMCASASTSPNTPAMSPGSGGCGCWRRSRRRGIQCRFYQASSSEMFGSPRRRRRARRRRFIRAALTLAPRSSPTHHGELPRGLRAARFQRHSVQPRVAAAWRDLRYAQNHPRRGPHQAGLQEKLYLGNLDARRDWGYAPIT